MEEIIWYKISCAVLDHPAETQFGQKRRVCGSKLSFVTILEFQFKRIASAAEVDIF